MTKTKDIIKSLTAVILSIIITASAAAIMCSISANAATVKTSSQKAVVNQLPKETSKINQFANAYVFKATGKTSYGYDWTYKTDYKNLKVKCSYDFKAHKYNFKITGTAYGLNHLTLKYKTSDKQWASQKMTIFVDSEKYIMRTA